MQLRTSARRAAALLAAGVLTATTAACGGDGGAAKQLTYWSMWQQNEPQAKVLRKAIKSFEKDTGIQVDVEWQGRDVLTKVVPALRSGNVPDLVDQGYGELRGALVVNDQFTDLSDVYSMQIPGENHTVGEVIPDKYRRFIETDEGTPYFVPYEIMGACIWYDANRLPEVAKSPPKTWQEFTDLLARRKASGHHPLALDGDIAGYDAYWTSIALMRTLGGADGLKKLVTDKDASSWNSPDVRTAIENIAALVENEYFVPGYDSSKFPAIQRKWAEGKADFILMGSWLPSETGPSAPDSFDYRCFNFPTMGGGYAVPTNSIGFAIPEPADNADAAKKFIAYFMNKKRLSGISEVAKNLTPRTDIPAPEELADLQRLLEQNEATEVLVGALAGMPDYRTKVFLPLSAKLLGGELTADEFIARMQKGQQQYWKTHD